MNDVEQSGKLWDALILRITQLRPHVVHKTTFLPSQNQKLK